MATLASEAKRPGIGTFERYLSVWVALCIFAGIGLGQLLPDTFAAIAAAEVARVNLVVAGLIWLMIVPMLLKIDFGSLGSVRQHWKGVGVTLFVNWAVKPSRWRRSAPSSSAGCSPRCCPRARSPPTSPG